MDLEKFGTAGDIQELLAVRDRINSFLDDGQGEEVLTPRADLLQIGDGYQLVMDVPGVSQANLEIALQGQELTIAGLRETLEEGAEAVFSERPIGHFQRTFELPAAVNREAATAHLRDGLLIVTLPKDLSPAPT